jgi:hypothetical protein
LNLLWASSPVQISIGRRCPLEMAKSLYREGDVAPKRRIGQGSGDVAHR